MQPEPGSSSRRRILSCLSINSQRLEMDEEQQIRRQILADWRNFEITQVGGLEGLRVGELDLPRLEWVRREWMPKVRMQWTKIDLELKKHYFALEAAVQALDPDLSLQMRSTRMTPQQSQTPGPSASRQQGLKLQTPQEWERQEIMPAPIGPARPKPAAAERLPDEEQVSKSSVD